MTLFKTAIWTGISTVIKIIFNYLMWKIIAVYTGPVGLAVIEQFQNFLQIARSFSSSLNQGIIKYVSEFKHDEDKKSLVLSSAFPVSIFIAIVVSIILICFSNEFSLKIFHSLDYSRTIKILAVSITLYSLNGLLLSVLNGEFEIKKYVASNISNTLLIFALTVYLVMHYGIQGGLIGFVFNQSVSLLLTVYLVVKSKWFKLSSYVSGIDKRTLVKLIRYSFISFAPVLIVPITLIIMRKFIASQLSWQEAGYWQGIMRLSEAYIILLEVMVNIYFLPKISSIKTLAEFKAEVFSTYRLVIPVAIIGLLFVFVFKKQIVMILYDKQFFPMLCLFKYQLIGDLAKIGAWLLMIIMAAKAMVKVLVISEIIFNITLLIFTFICVHYFGLIGTSIGFAINNVLCLISMSFWTMRCVRNGSFRLVT